VACVHKKDKHFKEFILLVPFSALQMTGIQSALEFLEAHLISGQHNWVL